MARLLTLFLSVMRKTKTMKKGKHQNINCQLIEVDPPKECIFDLEFWLANLLVEYWLSEGGDKERSERYVR